MNSEMTCTHFEVTWERIKQITGWSDYKDLAEFIGSSSQSISGVKKRGKFPLEWARKIALEFGSSTDFIMDGEGEMKRGSVTYPPCEQLNQDLAGFTVAQGSTKPTVTGAKKDLAWFHDWIDEEISGKSLSDVMAMAVKIKAVLDEGGKG